MREKNLVILCVIFAVLISLVFLKKSVKPEVPTTEEVTDIIKSAVNADNVTSMIIRLGDGSGGSDEDPKMVHLAKKDDQWVIPTQYGMFARDTTITPVLEKLDKIEGELRSNKKELLDDYGISDTKGVHVELQGQGVEPVHVIIGTESSGFRNNFVRHHGSNAVYVVNENLLGTLGARISDDDQKLDVSRWADKRIAHIDASQVVGIEIMEGDDASAKILDLKRELIEDKKQWQSALPYDFGLSASKIKSSIETFNNAYAQKVIAPDIEGVFDAPGWTGVYTLENGQQVKLIRGAKDEEESNYYVRQEGAGYFYLVPVNTFHSRKNLQGAIFADNPLKISEENIEEIKVRDLDANKEFSVVKKVAPPITEEAEEAGEAEEAESAKEPEKKDDTWETPNGETIDAAKVRGVINALKSIGLEIAPQPAMSLKDSMIVSVTSKEATTEYKISEINKSDTDKECFFLSVSGNPQSYCVSKTPITSLQNALP